MKKLDCLIAWVWLKVVISMALRDHDRLEWNVVFVSVCEPNKAICAVLLRCVTYQGYFAQVKVVQALNLSQERCFDNDSG